MKTTHKRAKFETRKSFCLLFRTGMWFSSKRIALKIEVIGLEDVLYAGASVPLSARKFYIVTGWGSEGVNYSLRLLLSPLNHWMHRFLVFDFTWLFVQLMNVTKIMVTLWPMSWWSVVKCVVWSLCTDSNTFVNEVVSMLWCIKRRCVCVCECVCVCVRACVRVYVCVRGCMRPHSKDKVRTVINGLYIGSVSQLSVTTYCTRQFNSHRIKLFCLSPTPPPSLPLSAHETNGFTIFIERSTFYLHCSLHRLMRCCWWYYSQIYSVKSWEYRWWFQHATRSVSDQFRCSVTRMLTWTSHHPPTPTPAQLPHPHA